MQYWLLKTEPNTWSWEDQLKVEMEGWDGVRNYQASNNMKKMKIGDLCFFYHSVKEKTIKGIVRVVKEYYPDHTDDTDRWGMVGVSAVCSVKTEVSLADIKAKAELQQMALVRQSRLSVSPVSKEEWQIITQMCNLSVKDFT
ncbi:MAG: EVE domain-containing protein [Alphaproteobacteria bacterium]